jgi:tryptophan synthase beta chain
MPAPIIPLHPDRIPRRWYNLAADLPKTLPPPLGPDGQPVRPEQLAPVFPMNLIEQEVSTQRWIDIPDEVLQTLLKWRPTPLRRCYSLEKHLGTPARIYVKDESVSPAGSHKPNTAVPQAWYNREFGIRKLTTETGAGQWGSAISFACSQFGLTCKVYMVRVSFDQKPFRKAMMQVWGGQCVASPSTETAAGRAVLAENPNSPGSLGIAISEAVEAAVSDPTGGTRYSLGSVLNHVCLHQTVIGLEAQEQLVLAGEKNPDVVIGCAGGGSNFAGIAFPFIREKINGARIEIIPVEPASCPTLTKTPYTYDHGDIARMTPLMPMHSLGHSFVPSPIHAGGLRYHGMAPTVSCAQEQGLLSPMALDQLECYAAAVTWARVEGNIPAPETSHALAAVIREAEKAKQEGKAKVILACYSGHGLMDLVGYQKYLAGELQDVGMSDMEVAKCLHMIKDHPKPTLR